MKVLNTTERSTRNGEDRKSYVTCILTPFKNKGKTVPSACKDAEHLGLSWFADECANGTAIVKNHMVVPWKVTQTFAV